MHEIYCDETKKSNSVIFNDFLLVFLIAVVKNSIYQTWRMMSTGDDAIPIQYLLICKMQKIILINK